MLVKSDVTLKFNVKENKHQPVFKAICMFLSFYEHQPDCELLLLFYLFIYFFLWHYIKLELSWYVEGRLLKVPKVACHIYTHCIYLLGELEMDISSM